MTEQQTKTFNLTLTQIAAAALAAVTAAVLGSRLGVAGTVIGAALASITTTTANAVYQHSLERSRERLIRTRAVLARPGVAGLVADPYSVHGPAVPAALPHAAADLDARAGVSTEGARVTPAGTRWRFVAAAGALAAFGLSLVLVTGLEAVRGEQLSGGGGTTVGQVLGGAANPAGNRQETPSTTPSPTSETTPDPTSVTSVEPSSEPSGTTTAVPPSTTSDPAPTGQPSTTTGDNSPAPPVPTLLPGQGQR